VRLRANARDERQASQQRMRFVLMLWLAMLIARGWSVGHTIA